MKKSVRLNGIYKNTERGYGFIEYGDKEEIFIAPKMMKDALNGDTVEFIIVNSAKPRKKG